MNVHDDGLVSVTLTRRFGDCGPCEHYDCDERATVRAEFTVFGVWARGWVCEEHADELENRLA